MTLRLNTQLLVAVVVATLAAHGCNLPPTQSIDEALQATRVEQLSQFGTNRIDILFVIADSSSIQDEQQRLLDALDGFVEGLNEIGADFHIGFTTPNVKPTIQRNKGGSLNSQPGFAFLKNVRPLLQTAEGQRVSCSTCQGECVDAVEDFGDEPFNLDTNGERSDESFAFCVQSEGETESFCYIRGTTCNSTKPELAYCNESGFDLGNYVAYSDFIDEANPEAGLTQDGLDGVLDQIQCLAFVGTCDASATTSGPERGLDAMRNALDESKNDLTGNAGFVRDDALLLVVLASDDDDCSVGPDNDGRGTPRLCWGADAAPLVPVEDYYSFLTNEVKDDEAQVFAAAIVGPAPSNFEWNAEAIACTARVSGLFEEADACVIDEESPSGACPNPGIGIGSSISCATPGDRYTRFVRLFGSRGAFGSVCEGNFEPVLQQLARAVRRNIGLNCVTDQPAECSRNSDCGGDARCVDAPPPLVPIEEIGSDGGVEGVECSTASDCPAADADEANAVCDRGLCYRPTFPAATAIRRFCSDFEVEIQVKAPGESNFESYESPGTVLELGDGNYSPERDYDLNLYAFEQCPQTGVAYRFLRQPPRESNVRIIYPISITDQASLGGR